MNARSTGDENAENLHMDLTEASQTVSKEKDDTETASPSPRATVDEKFVINESLKEAERHFVYFWEKDDILSQWHKAPFSIDGHEYCCAEQYMMYMKAVLLHDDKLAKKILKCSDPWRIKKLGRQTEQFSEDLWVHNCLHVVKTGNNAKFSQNEKLKNKLFSTYPSVLVEASPHDAVWGIGLDRHEPCAWNEATWEGKNLLGFILTEVRDEMMCKEGIIEESDKKVYFEMLSDDLRINSFGKRRKKDRHRRRSYTEESSSRYHHTSFEDVPRKRNPEDEAGASSHSVTASDQPTESSVDVNLVEEDVAEQKEMVPSTESCEYSYKPCESAARDEMGIENSVREKVAFDEIPAKQERPALDLKQGEERRIGMINKNERPKQSNKSETCSDEKCGVSESNR